MKSWRLLAAGLSFCTGMGLATGTPQAADRDFEPESRPFGKRFSEWSAEWWQLMLGIPSAESPLFDGTGDKCTVGQHGPVWFLVGVFGGGAAARTCAVPEGKSLYFPIINNVFIATEPQETVQFAREQVAPAIDAAKRLSVMLNGESVRIRPERARTRSIVFEVTLPNGDLGAPKGTYSPVVDDGYYVMLKPLPVGTHVLQFQAWDANGQILQDVTYNLTVVPVRLR